MAKRLYCCLLNLLFYLCGVTYQPALAQSPATSTPPEVLSNSTSVGPTSLTLDLIAIDEDGQPVTDLRPEELHLTLNKVEQKIEALTPAAGEPLAIGLFFDVSGSRRLDTHVAEETRLAGEFLRAVWHDGDKAFVITFNYEPFVMTQPTQKLEEIDEGLEQIPGVGRGATALYDALCLVKPEKLNAVPGRKVYVVFSDFEDNASRNRSERVLEIARQAKVFIFPMILGESFTGAPAKKIEKRTRQLAQTIADETGGEVLIPESRKQLAAMFERLASDLRAVYRLTYTSSAPSPEDKKKKKILLETTRPHVKLLYPKS